MSRVIRSWLGVIPVDKRGRLQRRVDGVVLIVCSLERKSADLWMFADEQQTDDYLYLRLVLTAVLVVIVLLCPSLCRRISEIAERERSHRDKQASHLAEH